MGDNAWIEWNDAMANQPQQPPVEVPQDVIDAHNIPMVIEGPAIAPEADDEADVDWDSVAFEAFFRAKGGK